MSATHEPSLDILAHSFSDLAQQFRDFTEKKRAALAEKGHAMPDGSFPIENESDLMNARHAVGRAKDPEAAKAHIRKRAKELGVTLPEDFSADIAGAQLAFAAVLELADAPETRVVDGVEYVIGKPIHVFPAGEWTAVDGRAVEFNAQDADSMIADLETRHADVAITFDHETDKARGSESAGWMPGKAFVWRADGLWNNEPHWRVDVYEKLLKTGAFRYLSGDAMGTGSAHPGDAFHPRRLLAASLVPKPGFVRGLKGITLGAKEDQMAKMSRAEFCQAMGLKASATTDELKKAFDEYMDEEGEEPEHQNAGAKACGCKETQFGDHRPDHSEEDCENDDCTHHPGAADDNEDDDGKDGEQMSGKNVTPGDGGKLSAEQFAARFETMGKELGASVTDAALKIAKEGGAAEAETRVKALFAAEAKAKEIEGLLADAQKDGRITAANEPTFRELFAAHFETGKKVLADLPKPAVAPGERLDRANTSVFGTITSGSTGISREDLVRIFDNDERDPAKYRAQEKILTAAARFSAHTGQKISTSLVAVCEGKNAKLEEEIFKAGDTTAEKFTGDYQGQFRASQRQIPVDPEMVEFIRKRIEKGAIPNGLISTELQQFASISDFQPSARTTLPMALGYVQAEFVGDEALPVYVGGADEKAAWPELAFEKFAAIAVPAGLLGSPMETSLNVVWHTVTVDKYPVRGNIDRRARAASITLPRGIDVLMLENLKSQVGTTKETAQATFLTTNGNYYDSGFYPSVTAWSSAGSPAAYVGLPITDITAGMQHVRVGVRRWPDLLLLSPAAATALRKNQQVIDTVRYTGTQERPGAIVPNSTLAALFAGMLNLTIAVGEAGTASLPSGSPVTDVWGLDAWLLCTGKGEIEAPRFGMTVAAAGSPKVRAFPAEHLGADGADSIVYTDSWNLVSVAKKAGYRMVGASAAI